MLLQDVLLQLDRQKAEVRAEVARVVARLVDPDDLATTTFYWILAENLGDQVIEGYKQAFLSGHLKPKP